MNIATKKDLFNLITDSPDEALYEKAKSNWNSIAKPLDGLGDFEDLICRISAITGTEKPDISNRAAVIFCADNGIVEEGISQSGKEVTVNVAKALGKGISSAASLGEMAKVKVFPVDIGIDCDEEICGVRNLKVSKGTCNFLKEPAMTESEVFCAIRRGIEIAGELKNQGYGIISMGEMGIGNTTTSTAVLCALLGLDCNKVTGRGAGLDDKGLLQKKEVIKQALEKYDFDSIADQKEKAFQILRSVGGLDIAGLAGLAIGGAIYHVPIVLDGLISSVAALTAEGMVPGTKAYLLPSHKGREGGNQLALEALGLSPYMNGDMALGEGTGAIMLFPLMDLVLGFYNNGAKFGDYEMDEYKRFAK